MEIKKIRRVCLVLLCIAVTGIVGSGKKDVNSKKHEPITFMAPYMDVDSFIKEVHKTYPEVNLKVVPYSGANTTVYLNTIMEENDLPDICTLTLYDPEQQDLSDKMLDLSGYAFTDNYVESRLKEVSDDGAIYMLPSAYNCFGITYNKTLLKKHGWTLPQSFGELKQLAKEAEKAGVQLCLPQIQYPGYGFQYLCNIADTGFLSSLDGRQWQKDYLSGKANVSTTKGMMDSMEYMQNKATIKDVVKQLEDDQESVVNNKPEVITTTTEDISQKNCAKLVGRCFAQATNSDLALVSLGTWISGNGLDQNNDGVSGKLYTKDITIDDLSTIIPTGWSRTIQTVRLTGKQIQDLYKEGYDAVGTGNNYSYILVSPIKLEEDKTYQVAISGISDKLKSEMEVTDSGIVGIDAAKEFFGKFKTLSEADAEWK